MWCRMRGTGIGDRRDVSLVCRPQSVSVCFVARRISAPGRLSPLTVCHRARIGGRSPAPMECRPSRRRKIGQKRSFEHHHERPTTRAKVCRVTDPWWKSLARILWWVLSRPWAVMMALGWPLLVAYGLMSPRAADLNALHLEPDDVALLVGIGGSADAGQRSYVVLPRAL